MADLTPEQQAIVISSLISIGLLIVVAYMFLLDIVERCIDRIVERSITTTEKEDETN